MSRSVSPSRDDPVVAGLSEAVGGPAGTRGLPHRFWTPVRVVLAVATVVLALGVVQKGPCVQSSWSSDQVRYGAMCYSDIPYLYTLRGMAEQTWPYADTHGRYETLEYPVGISYFAWGTAELTHLVGAGPPDAVRARTPVNSLFGLPGMTTEVNQYFLVNVVLLACFGLLAAGLLVRATPGRPWDAMGFAASPCLLVAAYVNWDLLAVACVALGLAAWARGRPVLAGVAAGLGTATKLYPIFLLGAYAVVCARERRWRDLSLASAGAAAAYVVLDLPAWVTGFSRWTVFWSFNSHRGPDLGSLWLYASELGATASTHAVNVVSWVVVLAACAAVLVLGLRAPRTPRVAQLAFLLVGVFLLVNKVYSPQYVLWLLPLAAIARPRWRDLLIWQGCELVYFAGVWLSLGSYTAPSTPGAPDTAYLVTILVRVAGELYLMARVLVDVLRPEDDPGRLPVPEPAQLTTTRSKATVV